VYSNIGTTFPQAWAGTILAIVAIFVTLPAFYFYANGEKIRKNSKFAAKIAQEREEEENDTNGKNKGTAQHVEDAA